MLVTIVWNGIDEKQFYGSIPEFSDKYAYFPQVIIPIIHSLNGVKKNH